MCEPVISAMRASERARLAEITNRENEVHGFWMRCASRILKDAAGCEGAIERQSARWSSLVWEPRAGPVIRPYAQGAWPGRWWQACF
jgi:hypothetical protein